MGRGINKTLWSTIEGQVWSVDKENEARFFKPKTAPENSGQGERLQAMVQEGIEGAESEQQTPRPKKSKKSRKEDQQEGLGKRKAVE